MHPVHSALQMHELRVTEPAIQRNIMLQCATTTGNTKAIRDPALARGTVIEPHTTSPGNNLSVSSEMVSGGLRRCQSAVLGICGRS